MTDTQTQWAVELLTLKNAMGAMRGKRCPVTATVIARLTATLTK